MRLLVWNLEWRRPSSVRGRAIQKKIREINPDLAVLTEVDGSFFVAGETASGNSDWGYPAPASRRKVQIWSRTGWQKVDAIGSEGLPGGRFVSGVTKTSSGPIRVLGVCIPWRDAHVRTGRCDRRPWEDHLEYLKELRTILTRSAGPCILAGDWNQRIPRSRQPRHVFDALEKSIPRSFHVATAGEIVPLASQLIDHVAVSGLEVKDVRGVSRGDEFAGQLSDHDGVVVDLVNSCSV